MPLWDGDKVRGVLVAEDGAETSLVSGETGDGQWLVANLPGGPGSGLTRAWTHVEGHAAGRMHRKTISHATLYINKIPCGTGAAKCRFVLHKLLPQDATLDVHFPHDTGGVGIWRFTGGVKGWSVLQ